MNNDRRHSLGLVGAMGICLSALALTLPTAVRAQQVDIKPSPKVKKDKYVITKEEIAERTDLVSGYDVVKSLRNQWLRVTRASGSALGRVDASTGAQDKLCSGGRTDPSCTAAGTSDKSSPVPHESGSPYAESGASTNSPGAATPVLYIDEIRQPGLDELRNISVISPVAVMGFEMEANGWKNILYRGYLQGETPATMPAYRRTRSPISFRHAANGFS